LAVGQRGRTYFYSYDRIRLLLWNRYNSGTRPSSNLRVFVCCSLIFCQFGKKISAKQLNGFSSRSVTTAVFLLTIFDVFVNWKVKAKNFRIPLKKIFQKVSF
jgi:hypothetical protein